MSSEEVVDAEDVDGDVLVEDWLSPASLKIKDNEVNSPIYAYFSNL